LGLLALACPAADVLLLDGSTRAAVLGLTGTSVVLSVGTLDLAEVDRLSQGEAPAAVRSGVLLRDGGWLPAARIAAGSEDHLAVSGPLGELVIPLTAVAGWGDTELAGDQDRVVVTSGPLEGRVLGIRDGHVRLQSNLSPEPLTLALDQVLAVRLAVPMTPPTGLHLAWRGDAAHQPLRLRPAATPTLIAAPGVAIALDRLTGSLRVEGGSRRYLSDLTPTTVADEGAFGVVWPWQRDRDLDGRPLLLGGERFDKGLTVHSRAVLTWNVAGSRRFSARVGIADVIAPEGDCLVFFEADGRIVWQSRLKGGEPARPVALDLRGVTVLILRVELGERHDIGDHVMLVDAWIH